MSSLETVCLMLNPVFKLSTGTCQQFVEDAVKISNIYRFRLSRLFRTRKGDLLWLEDDLRERKWISLSLFERKWSSCWSSVWTGWSQHIRLYHHLYVCCDHKNFGGARGGAAARSANACIRHWRGSVATYDRWDGSLCVYTLRIFWRIGDRILKIGPHLPKLLSNIKGLGFFGTRCIYQFINNYI